MKRIISFNFYQANQITILAALAIFLISGCHSLTTYDSLDEMVSAEKNEVMMISLDDFNQHLENGHHNLIVDCRETHDYLEGHIPGAISIPRGDLGFSPKISVRRDNVYIYCNNEDAAILSAVTLRQLKYRHVWVVQSGWEGWKNAWPDAIETGAGDDGAAEVVVEESGGGCGG